MNKTERLLTGILIQLASVVVILVVGFIFSVLASAEEYEIPRSPPGPILSIRDDSEIKIVKGLFEYEPPKNIIFTIDGRKILVMGHDEFKVYGKTMKDPARLYEAMMEYLGFYDRRCEPEDEEQN